MQDSVGPSETNLNILQEAATFLSCLTGPWIIGGDWNMSPQTLASTRFPNVVHGMIVAPDLPTCNDSTYDYFIVSEGLLPSVAGVARIEDAGLKPHWPVRLYLRSNARRHLVRQLVRPRKIPGVLPHGPAARPPDFSDAIPASVSRHEVDRCVHSWYKKVREELNCLNGHASAKYCPSSDSADAHRFK